ncbi:MAG: InlB B-repeat-containing protein [Clostridia bacterium]|nr:InlB B-repeat-containing protein [Clostridia bacterium]
MKKSFLKLISVMTVCIMAAFAFAAALPISAAEAEDYKVTVTVHAVDTAGTPVSGISFDITTYPAEGAGGETPTVKTVTTEANGSVTVTLQKSVLSNIVDCTISSESSTDYTWGGATNDPNNPVRTAEISGEGAKKGDKNHNEVADISGAVGDVSIAFTIKVESNDSSIEGHSITYKPNTEAEVAGMPSDTDTVYNNDGSHEFALPETAPARTGYKFLGWAESESGTVIDSTTYNAAGTAALYAIWQAETYTVTFDVNEGDALTPGTMDVTYDAAYGGLPAPTRTGYTFDGWKDASDNAVTADTVYTVADDSTLTAQWIAVTYTVKLDANGGTGSMDDMGWDYDRGYALPESTFTRVGHTFGGWNTAADGTGEAYADKQSGVKNLADEAGEVVTLYAQWTPNVYKVKLVLNGGEVVEDDVTEYTYGVGVRLPDEVEKKGYEFMGWYDNKNLSGRNVTKITATDIGDKVFYADWDNKINEGILAVIAKKNTKHDVEIIDDIANGEVETSHDDAYRNATVTVTVTPNENYELADVTVVDSNGDVIELTKEEDGTYTFKMPGRDVSVSAEFTEITTENEEEKPVDTTEPVEGSTECLRNESCPLASYVDLDRSEWYHDGLHYVLANKLMDGNADGSFGVSGDTTRSMIVTALWRHEGSPVVNYAMSFADVASDVSYAEAIRWAAAVGVVEGYSDIAFGPDDAVTREQMATIMWRYTKLKGGDVSAYKDTSLSYADAANIGEWALDAMKWACGTGMIEGVPGSLIVPQGSSTRVQTATILYRYFTK